MMETEVLENASAITRMELRSPFTTMPGTLTELAPASRYMPFVDFREEAAMALANDYLTTKQAFIAMTRAFRRYIEYSARYDACILGDVCEDELNALAREFGPVPIDEDALSGWIEMALRETGMDLFTDELATMFDAPETQVEHVLDSLLSRGHIIQSD
jgi:hypothetical protein